MKKGASITKDRETRQSAGRGGTRRDTKGSFTTIGVLANAVVKEIIRNRNGDGR